MELHVTFNNLMFITYVLGKNIVVIFVLSIVFSIRQSLVHFLISRLFEYLYRGSRIGIGWDLFWICESA